MSFDVVIVGSGAAGVWAAEALRGLRVAMVDVGVEAPRPRLGGEDFYALREQREDLCAELLGEGFEGLAPLFGEPLNPKLRGPALRYVTERSDELAPIVSERFRAVTSLSRGGLANAWGAGVFAYDDADLEGFPLRAAELAPAYARLVEALAINGCDDDLRPFFGDASALDAPPELDGQAELFLRRYARHRRALQARGIHVGRQRLAVATRARPGRPPYRYAGLDFFEPERPAVYTPSETLDALIRDGALTYLPGRLATRFEEREAEVVLEMKELASGGREELRAGRLLLAAGALGSARLVLASGDEPDARLPILDNPVSFVPLLAPERIGRAQSPHFFGGGLLNLIYRGEAEAEPVQGSFYGLSGILRSDFAMDLPLGASGLPDAARWLAPALAVLQLFYADAPDPQNRVRYRPDGALEIEYRERPRGRVEGLLLRALRKLGYFGLPRLCQYPPPGSSIHYAGTLPMRDEPGPFETHPDGRLSGSRRVHVCDAATFPRLPAKNLTLTAMANAMRIAERVGAALR